MANGADIAKAYVEIVPSADGIKGKLTELLGGEAETAGKQSGGKFSKFFGGALKAGGMAVTGMATAATALTGTLLAGANATADYGDNIDKMSQKMGLSATAYQEWDAIMQHSGTSIDSMQRGMTTLSKAAEAGSDAFEKLGISQEDLASMSQEELFAATIQGLQGMESGTERTALAQQLLGGSSKELGALLNMSAEETEAMRQRVHELGGVMSDDAVKAAAAYKDSLQDMQTAFAGAKRGLMSDFMPAITTVMDGLTMIFSGDSGGIGKISEGINQFINSLSTQMPQFMQAGSQILMSIVEAIVANLPQLLGAASDVIMTLTQGIIENLPALIESGLQVLVTLAMGIAENLPTLIPTIVDVVIEIVETLIDNVDMLVDSAIAIIVALADGLIRALPKLIAKAPEIVGKLVDAIVRNAPKLLKSAAEIIKQLVTGIANNLSQIFSKGQEIVQKVISGVGNAIGGLWSAGMDIVRGLWRGISDGLGWIKSRISGWVGDVMSFIKGLFGIHSPSTWARDEIGLNIARGIGLGFEAGMTDVELAMKAALPDMAMTAGVSGTSVLRSAPAYNYGGVTIQILGREKDADTLARELQSALVRRATVWA